MVMIWEGVTLLDLSSNSEGRMESILHDGALFVWHHTRSDRRRADPKLWEKHSNLTKGVRRSLPRGGILRTLQLGFKWAITGKQYWRCGENRECA